MSEDVEDIDITKLLANPNPNPNKPRLSRSVGWHKEIGRRELNSSAIWVGVNCPVQYKDAANDPELVPTQRSIDMLKSSNAANTPAWRAKAQKPEERIKSVGMVVSCMLLYLCEEIVLARRGLCKATEKLRWKPTKHKIHPIQGDTIVCWSV